ncbi:hypothetical protein BJF79_43770 [Actinomadura sp. CNU-125]|uniref:hypothetical protein n=1 Tax=Actinomadura sp. CNU-125 TaxID=1904961 RepID=UPI00095F222E|nr:hypothetical protein [Actinomadura sp. CNU-125]OLT26173.1 hypothetical protein BJF79_43770 [Actinomadura sp. CNU-125]
MTAAYFDDLAARLRAAGVSADAAAGTVAELAAHVAESGTDPEDEFGPAAEFAAVLHPSGGGGEPGPSDETWRWTADAFQDRRLLDRFGDQGWEVERVDSAGRFVSRRDPERPQRWDYRRETVLPGRRTALAARLAPDGWEPCGTWICFEYFKRPKAATLGPDAELPAAPAAPSRRTFWSRRFYAFLAAYTLLLVGAATAWLVLGDADDRDGFGGGFLTGALAGAALAALVAIASTVIKLRRRP